MAIASVGYEGSINEGAWSRYGAWFGLPPGISTTSDLALTLSGNNVTIGPGIAYGHNIVDVVGLTTVTNTPPAAGVTRYDTVCLRRDWTVTGPTPDAGTAGGATTLVVVQGGSTAVVSGSLLNSPGVTQADQPLYLIAVTSVAQTMVANLTAVHGTAALVRSKQAMTGRAGTQYTLKDGSAEDGSRWVMSLSSAGTVVATKEYDPPTMAWGSATSVACNSNGYMVITHNLGYVPTVFQASYWGTETSAAWVLETAATPAGVTSTAAAVYAKRWTGTAWVNATATTVFSRINWIAGR